ncbi:MAG TPA: hypothetical protein VGK78_07600 [Nocardioides sp.]|uniref:hypothetical protein n=1 Tax=Nocardioides sp. TaxID=35761 RepID=UPI002F3E887D
MYPLTRLLTHCLLLVTTPRRRDERGDVPGWVLVTVMTAGLVGALYSLAKPQLSDILTSALNSVH